MFFSRSRSFFPGKSTHYYTTQVYFKSGNDTEKANVCVHKLCENDDGREMTSLSQFSPFPFLCFAHKKTKTNIYLENVDTSSCSQKRRACITSINHEQTHNKECANFSSFSWTPFFQPVGLTSPQTLPTQKWEFCVTRWRLLCVIHLISSCVTTWVRGWSSYYSISWQCT